MAIAPDPDEVIIEFHRVGASVKVTALHSASLVEVSIIAPASTTEAAMRQAVLKKLAFVRSRQRGAG